MGRSAKQILFKVFQTGYCLFIGLLLIFGRAFAIINIPTPFVPIFITEIFLLMGMIGIFFNLGKVKKIPKHFLMVIVLYLLLGCMHLFVGILNKNIFALRDIVHCLYIFFLFITFFIFSDTGKLKLFIKILFIANIASLIVGRLYITQIIFNFAPNSLSVYLNDFLIKMKAFNFGLYYGISISFLIPYFCLIKNKIVRMAVLIIISLDLYMLIMFAERTLWLAVFFLFIFLLFILRKKFVVLAFKIIFTTFLITTVFHFIDFSSRSNSHINVITSKMDNMVVLFKDFFIEEDSQSSDVPDSEINFTDELLPCDDLGYIKEDNESIFGHMSGRLMQITAAIQDDDVKRTNMDGIYWRLSILEQAISFGMRAPIWGRGFGVYPEYKIWDYPPNILNKKHIGTGIVPVHNHLATIFYKMGFVGLSLFLLCNIYIFMYGLLNLAKCRSSFLRAFLIGSLCSFVFWHVVALFFDAIDSPPTTIFLWIISGFIFVVGYLNKEKSAS